MLILSYILFKCKEKFENIQISNNVKYYFSFTTSPQRLKHLIPILERLQNQSIKPEKIIINIPPKFKRTNEAYDYDVIKKIEDAIPLVHFNRIEKDYGPLSKVIGVLQYIKDDNAIIIVCDDDIYYKNDFAKEFIKKIIENKEKLIAGFAYRHTSNFGFNIAEGFNGYGFYKKLIDYNKLIELYNIIEPYTHCYKSDDFVLSYFLKINNIDVIEAGYSPLESYSENEHIDELQTQDNIIGHVDRYKQCKDYIDKYYINREEKKIPEEPVLQYDVVIVGTAKDIEKYLPETKKKLKMIKSLFKSSKVIIYENDSNDKTLDILKEWEKEGFIQLITEKNVSGKRTQRLAHGRNILLKEAMKNNFDIYIVTDLDDIIKNLDSEGILSTFKMKEDWAMVGGNQKDRTYYDIWALRTFDEWLDFDFEYCRNVEKKDENYCFHSRLRNILPDAEPIQVKSCFGGIGIYKKSFLENCNYGNGLRDNTIDVEECEHVKLNEGIIRNGGKIYINPKMITS